eukprot:406607_1
MTFETRATKISHNIINRIYLFVLSGLIVIQIFRFKMINAQQWECNYANHSLPISIYAHETAFHKQSSTVYLFGGDASFAVYKWNIRDKFWIKLNIRTAPQATINFWTYTKKK